MARAHSASPSQEDQTAKSGTEWQALRGELVTLLDQVADAYGRTPEDRNYEKLARRVDEIRARVGDAPDAERHKEALRSVKRAVSRFQERDDDEMAVETTLPPNPRDLLQSAIYEIRSSQRLPESPSVVVPPVAREAKPEPRMSVRVPGGEMTPPRFVDEPLTAIPQALVPPAVAPRDDMAPRFDALAGAVQGLAGRLERMESELKVQRDLDPTREIVEQVRDLSLVVDGLAEAVGEKGDMKRLEAQMAALAELVGTREKPQVDALTQRLDDLAATIERLTDIQLQHFGRDSREAPARAAQLQHSMDNVEHSVRSIYDRIDVLEKGLDKPSPAVDRLTDELAAFTVVMRENGAQPNRLVPLIDELTRRVGEIERHDGAVVSELKQDIGELRHAVLDAVEPRFAALQDQLDRLNQKVDDGAQDTGALDVLGAEIRRLVEKMDETGSQLAGLSQLYQKDQKDRRSKLPDFDKLAEKVAQKTSQAVIAQVPQPAEPGPAALSPEGLDAIEERMSRLIAQVPAPVEPGPAALSPEGLDAIEERVSRLIQAQERSAPEPEPVVVPELSGMQDGIKRVDERLERLEAALSKFAREQAELQDEQFRAGAQAAKAVFATAGAATDKPRASEGPKPVRVPGVPDSMPLNPTDEYPLTDRSFADLPASDNLLEEAWSLLRHSEDAGAPAKPQAKDAAPAAFDPANVVRPPRPQSTLMAEADPFAASAGATTAREPIRSETTLPTAQTRNTFIEAARRASQRQHAGKAAAAAAPNSLLSRAFSRFQATTPVEAPVAAPIVAPQPEATKPVEPAIAVEAEGAEDSIVVPESMIEAPESEIAVRESFLARHRRPILLGAAAVAVSLMTLNLVAQYVTPGADTTLSTNKVVTVPVKAPEAPKAKAAAPVVAENAAPAAPAASAAAPAVDPVSVGAITPLAVPEANTSGEDTALPPVLAEGASDITLPALPQTAATLDEVTPPADGETPAAVAVEPPPESVGPEALRTAAAAGDMHAQFEVAAIYSEGRTVAQDYAAAATWYERAAAQGFVPAQYRMGNLYESGKGLDKDFAQARLWYQRAAEAGNRMAMHNLAALYASGELGEQDFASAAEWFQRAADRGMTDSQFNLGMLYARGLGVTQDLAVSYKWFSLAANNGDKDAAKARDDVAKSLSPQQMSDAEAEIAAWKATPIDLVANFAPIGTWTSDFDPGAPITAQDVVSKVQGALVRLGYDVGKADGVAGPKTAEAIKSFEHSIGMNEIGAINPRLLAVLGSQPV